MRRVVIIPARYKSSRFPGKPLINLLGKPMILWVSELSAQAVGKKNVYIATDDEQISKVVSTAGFNAIMTSSECSTGTDRLAEAANQISADIYINIQGDEPLIDPEAIDSVIRELNEDIGVSNAFVRITEPYKMMDTDVVKVVIDKNYQALYYSRLGIPFGKDENPYVFQQLGLYAFSRAKLQNFRHMIRHPLERAESVEMLRYLEHGFKVQMVLVEDDGLSVDSPKDVKLVEQRINAFN